MYCRECGTENNENNAFCIKCGAQFKNMEENCVVQKNNESAQPNNYSKEIVVNNLKCALSPLNQYMQLNNNRNALLNEIQTGEQKKKVMYAQKDGVIIASVLGPLLLLIFNYCAAAIIMGFYFQIARYKEPYSTSFGWLNMMTWIFIIIVLLSVIEGVLINFIAKKIAKASHDKKSKIIDNRRKVLNSQIEEISMQMETVAVEIQKYSNTIPPDYCYPMAVEYFYKAFINGRARNMTEATNLFEEQVHRWKIEKYQEQIIIMQRQQQQSLQGIRTSTNINTALNITRFLLK